MNFEFSADQMQLKDIARKFLEKEESVKRARNVLEGEASYDEDLWSQIIEMVSKRCPGRSPKVFQMVSTQVGGMSRRR